MRVYTEILVTFRQLEISGFTADLVFQLLRMRMSSKL